MKTFTLNRRWRAQANSKSEFLALLRDATAEGRLDDYYAGEYVIEDQPTSVFEQVKKQLKG